LQNVSEHPDSVIALETIESDEQLSASEKTSKGLDSFKNMMSAAPSFLEFMDARNTTLLEQEMGLGEYIYIYMAAYAEEMASEPDGPYAGEEEAYLSPRARNDFAQILHNQLAAAEAAGMESPAYALVPSLKVEISALEDGSHESPWPDGVPDIAGESLGLYREQISGLYCQGIIRVETLQKRRGLLSGG
jgi:hypothetical protein